MKINRINFNQGISISDIKINDKPQNRFAGLDEQPVQLTNISKTDVLNTPSQKPVENSAVSNFPNWIMPAHGRLSSAYGWRIHPIQKTRKWHNGIDIANNTGTEIKAPAAGHVYYVGYENNYNGNTIRIDHGIVNGVKVESVYIHLQGFNVSRGHDVKQGQVIGFMGSTGNSTGPHLHVSIYEGKRGNDVNPFKYIDKSKY
ncbi:M23 family metallopeptidase [bacterium]|nr:M23 family metallopeptidase [bacterium]